MGPCSSRALLRGAVGACVDQYYSQDRGGCISALVWRSTGGVLISLYGGNREAWIYMVFYV